MSSEYEFDLELKAELDRLAMFPATSGTWNDVEERAHKKGWRPEERWSLAPEPEKRVADRKQVSAPRRRIRLRVAVFASIAIVLVAAITVGSLLAVQSLTSPHFVLAINDETMMEPGGTGQIDATAGQWQRLPLSIEGGTIHCVAASGDDAGTLYAGTDDGLFRSTDKAESWERISEVCGGVFNVFTDPAAPSTVYVKFFDGQDTPRLMRSDDSGDTWVDLSGNVSLEGSDIGGYVSGIVFFNTTTNPSTVYMCVGGRMSRSTDKGETWWTPLTTVEEDKVWEEMIDPSGPPTAADQAEDAFRESFNGTLTEAETGASIRVNTAPSPESNVHTDPSEPSIFYAATYDGVYKSVDGGKTWRKASKGLWATDNLTLIPDPTSASVLYATTVAGIFKSTDTGETWEMVLRGEGSAVVAPSSPSTLYAWTVDGLFRSDDAGKNWTELPAAGLPPRPSWWGFELEGLLLVAPQDPNEVFAVSVSPTGTEEPRYVYRTTDGGKSWTPVLEYGGGLVADPSDPSTLYAPEGKDWCKSTDLGSTWTVLSRENWVDPIWEIVVDPYGLSAVNIIQKSEAGAYSVSRSLDGGVTWQKVRLEGVARYLDYFALDPHSANTLYVLAQEPTETGEKAGMYRSTDDGRSWEDITGALAEAGVTRIVPDPAPGGALYVVAQNGLFKWVEASGGETDGATR